MFRKVKTLQRNKRGFSLIELIVVIAIVGIMVMIAAPKFLGFTKDGEVAAMKTDAKVLSDAAMLYSIDSNLVWPIGDEITKSEELEAVIGDTAVYEIDEEELRPYVKGLKGDYLDYGLIIDGSLEGEVVHLQGVQDEGNIVWYGPDLNDGVDSTEDTDFEACAVGTYLADDDDFSGDIDGSFVYIGTETEVRIPHIIKGSPVTSYYGMFAGTNVTKVVSDNPNITDMSSMFAWTVGASLDLSCFDTSGVTNMSEMFTESEIPELDLSYFDTSNVMDMSWMFCDGLTTSIDFTGWDTSSVTDMSNMFNGSEAETLNLSSFNTSNVNTMQGMFYWSLATSINLSSFNTSNVEDMDMMFCGSYAEELDLSHFNTSSVTDMMDMFNGLSAVVLDVSDFNTFNVTDMSGMFANTYMDELDLSSFNTDNASTMDDMFEGSTATTGYARTQTDADRFNASSNIPAGLNFIPKP